MPTPKKNKVNTGKKKQSKGPSFGYKMTKIAVKREAEEPKTLKMPEFKKFEKMPLKTKKK